MPADAPQPADPTPPPPVVDGRRPAASPPRDRAPRARVVLLTGPSGSGKSRLARESGLPVLALDDFYRDGDDPALPRLAGGMVDWDSPGSWHAQDAVEAVTRLATKGHADVPVYDIAHDGRVGHREVVIGDAPAFVAEGIFAAEIIAACRARGVLGDALCLRRPRLLTFTFRLVRDLREHRKRPWVLARRGWALMRVEPAIVARAAANGAAPCGKCVALARISAVVGTAEHAQTSAA